MVVLARHFIACSAGFILIQLGILEDMRLGCTSSQARPKNAILLGSVCILRLALLPRFEPSFLNELLHISFLCNLEIFQIMRIARIVITASTETHCCWIDWLNSLFTFCLDYDWVMVWLELCTVACFDISLSIHWSSSLGVVRVLDSISLSTFYILGNCCKVDYLFRSCEQQASCKLATHKKLKQVPTIGTMQKGPACKKVLFFSFAYK